ncbi:MAG: exodeoxyribonuclease VII small subunit [Bacilli bacterium]|nr:exodeoxyribonuclease VII small subunit [Bacilli bacterium]
MKKQMTFEEKMARLDEIVKILDKNEIDLEKSLVLYEEAKELIKDLNLTITEAKNKVNND